MTDLPTPAPAERMGEPMEFTIGSAVACRDGACGDLRRVVVDPVARAITHLVVEPRRHSGSGHLVPVDLVESTAPEIRLQCTAAEFHALDEAEETEFLPGASGEWSYEQEQMLSLPYYGLRVGSLGGGIGLGDMSMGGGTHAITSDRIPVGEVEVRRGDHVDATDGRIGRIQGLVVDPRDHHVTHLLLQEGHLWGQKRVSIPIANVSRIAAVVRLNLTKDEVRDLPSVDVDHPM